MSLHVIDVQIGLECQLSVEDLAYEVQHTFVCFREQQQQQDQEQQPDHQLPQENLMYSAMTI
jgi:hypothetical protein